MEAIEIAPLGIRIEIEAEVDGALRGKGIWTLGDRTREGGARAVRARLRRGSCPRRDQPMPLALS